MLLKTLTCADMIISKLIAELQKVQAEHGDIPVEIDGPEWLEEVDNIKLRYPSKPGAIWFEADTTQPVYSIILS
jgi:hypothetical protein